VPQLLRGHRAAHGEILAAVEVGLRPSEVGAPLVDDRRQLVTIGKHRASLAHRARQLLLGILQRDPRIGYVEPDELLSRMHQIGLVRPDGHHGAAHLRHDVDQVAGDIGIVGALVVARVQQPPGERHQGDEKHGHREDDEPPAAALLQRAGDG
jgi:hypothetical protein